jgi:hypothetical protein
MIWEHLNMLELRALKRGYHSMELLKKHLHWALEQDYHQDY